MSSNAQKNEPIKSATNAGTATQRAGGDVAPPATPGGYRLPDNVTLQHASSMSIANDKPIMLDYWTASLDKTALIGVKEDGAEKLLVKSAEEYTSPIVKIFKVSNEYIVVTENSIYLVDVSIPTKRISV
jgi:hypothetical protein